MSDIFPELLINFGKQSYSDSMYLAEPGANSRDLLYHVKRAIDFSDRVDILVGFFFFSGFLKLHKNLKDKEIRILVGMDLEQGLRDMISATLRERSGLNHYNFDTLQQESLKKMFKKLFNSDYFENSETKQAFDVFMQKLKDGTLEVRKTHETVHAKLYIFHFRKNNYDKGVIITGSSNLTASGLSNNREVNVLLKSENALTKSLNFFEDLWQLASPILNKNSVDDFEAFITKETWWNYSITPYKAYLKAIYEYFKTIKPERFNINPKKYGYKSFSWQQDALWQAIRSIDAHGGVLLGDVVGLGKSVVASMIAKYYDEKYRLLDKNLLVVVICPPILIPQWKEYLKSFKLDATHVYSNSIQGIEQAFNDTSYLKDTDILFIIDEAHSIRNESSIRYKLLYDTVFGHKVVLLSATPYNNRPSEIISLVKLFQLPNATTLPVTKNLNVLAKQLDDKYNEAKLERDENKRYKLVNKVRDDLIKIIEPILVRRTRQDLEKITRYKNALTKLGIKLPQVKGPYLLELPDVNKHAQLISTTLEVLLGDDGPINTEYNGFRGATYMTLTYLKKDAIKKYQEFVEDYFRMEFENAKRIQKQNADLIKRLMLIRLESSNFAFFRTLVKLLGNLKVLFKDIEKTRQIRLQKDFGTIDFQGLFQDSESLPKEKNNIDKNGSKSDTFIIDIDDLQPQFLEHINSDIRVLKHILNLWYKNWFNTEANIDLLIDEVFNHSERAERLLERFNSIALEDPKSKMLINTVKEWFKNQRTFPDKYGKLIIFTEFADTARYFYNVLKQVLPEQNPLLFTSKHKNKKTTLTLKYNFDANFKKRRDILDKDIPEHNILVATDVLSEGINLHRANAIINIDIPYNPSRVVQRVGRINRISGMKYDTIYIYNYFPSYISEEHINIKNISTLKRQLANILFGADSPVLTEAEWKDIEKYSKEKFVQKYKESYKKILEQELEQESWDIKYLNMYFNIINSDKTLIEELERMPLRIKLARDTKNVNLNCVKEESESVDDNFITFIKEGNNTSFYLASVKHLTNGAEESIDLIPLTPKTAFDILEANKDEEAVIIKDKYLNTIKLILAEVQKERKKGKVRTHIGRGNRKKVLDRLEPIFDYLNRDCENRIKKYFENLYTIALDYGGLPPKTLGELANALSVVYDKDQVNIENLVQELEKVLPFDTLQRFIEKGNKLKRLKQKVIITEQLIK